MAAGREIAIHLVGIPHVTVPMDSVFPGKGYILVAMLLLASSRRMSRQAVAALLWEDAPEAKALTNLRQLLVRVNRCWSRPEPLVEASGSHLIAGAGAEHSDLAVLLNLRKSQVLAERVEAVGLAHGELLDGVDTGGPELSQWFRGERERFRRLVLVLAGEVLTEMTRFGRALEREIEAVGERMLALEPEREDTYRALIEAYGRNGSMDDANRTFEALKAMLQREFNAAPRPETLAAMRRVQANAPRARLQVVSDSGDVPPVQEMTRELTAVKNLAGLPRVALFPPTVLPGQALNPLHRALIEDVTNELSRHRTFVVVAPHSSFGVADDPDAERVAALRSGYLVSGYMVPGSEHMALRLTRQPGDEIIWASEYPVALEHLSASFRLISLQIALTLAHEIERDQLDRLRANPKPVAYRHYLEGQLKLKNCDLPQLRRARSEFRQAVQEDNQFAPTHARIAQTLQLEWLMLGGTDPYLLHQAKMAAELAIEIDTGSGMGHWMAGVVALYQRDFEHSAQKFLQAEALSPHSADLLLEHADALSHFGEPEAGWVRFQRALELNPMPPDHYWWAGASIAIRRRNYKDAIELCNRMESDQAVLRTLAIAHALLGNIKVARNYGRRLRENYPDLSARAMAAMAPDRHKEDVELVTEGLRIAGLE